MCRPSPLPRDRYQPQPAGNGVYVPVKKPAGVKELDIDTRARNALLRSVRCLGERGFALLTQRWKTLQHVTASPRRIGTCLGHVTGDVVTRPASSPAPRSSWRYSSTR